MQAASSIPDGSPFTLNNIPFGVFSTKLEPQPRCAIAVGDYVLDLPKYFKCESSALQRIEIDETQDLGLIFQQASEILESCFIPRREVIMHLPMKVGGYSDFFCSLEHCQNCSPMTGGPPKNFFHAPSAYNGRVSSIIVSGQSIRRPSGVMYDTGKGHGQPLYARSKKMDFELEIGYFVSKPIAFGDTMSINSAPEHIFGFVLLNDWSSRDIQAFEMKPLGPFNSKGFGTCVSPWVVTLDALMPFACQPTHKHSPVELEHLRWNQWSTATFNITLTASVIRQQKKNLVAASNLRYLYWTPYQQICHHASANCGLGTGDLIGSGTVSGAAQGELGCLFEATKDGAVPIEFSDGTVLGYLKDYDEVVLEAWCGEGRERIGFGDCCGMLLPASP